MMAKPHFSNSVVFALDSREKFSFVPANYLVFDNDDSPASNLIMGDFELIWGEYSQSGGEYIEVKMFVELRDFLDKAETATIGQTLEFNSKERIVKLRFTRQETTLRIAGQMPTDECPQVFYSNFQKEIEKRFEIQLHFYCNFTLDKVPAVVEQMNNILQAIDYPGPSKSPPIEQ